MSLPAIFIRKSTGDILLPNGVYPNVDMSPVQGLENSDYQWLLKHTPLESPVFDSRIWVLVNVLPKLKVMATEGTLDTLPPHPDYPDVKAYQLTYETEKRPEEDIIKSIGDACESANRELLTYRTTESMLISTAGILSRVQSGVQPSVTDQEILHRLMEFDVKIRKNEDTKQLKIQQVEQGQEPEIDEGWERL